MLGHSLLRTEAQITGVPLQQSQLLYLPAILQQKHRHRKCLNCPAQLLLLYNYY